MTATWCLSDFSKRIRALPFGEWKPAVESMPERCPRDCRRGCREVCAEYARMQWQMARERERIKREAKQTNTRARR